MHIIVDQMYLVYYNLELLIRLEKHRDHGFF